MQVLSLYTSSSLNREYIEALVLDGTQYSLDQFLLTAIAHNKPAKLSVAECLCDPCLIKFSRTDSATRNAYKQMLSLYWG